MKTYIDQMSRRIVLTDLPKRIVSIVPSQTELLHYLGLNERVVGITKFCVHPNDWFETKARVGGTKMVNMGKVEALQPDLIIANKEENTKGDIERLMDIAPVWISDIYNLRDACEMITSLGELTGTVDKARFLAETIDRGFAEFNSKLSGKSVLYLIWKDPYMAVGEQTFIHSLLVDELGMTNVVTPLQRYPEVDFRNLNSEPDFIFLSSEPYPFQPKHFDEFKKVFPRSQVVLVDGEYFSWYGSRLQQTPMYFEQLQRSLIKSE